MVMEVSWKLLPALGMPPSPREAHVLLALDAHRVLLLGGGSVSPALGPQQFNDAFVLDLKEQKWSFIPTKGEQPSPRTGFTAVLLADQRVLVFGGSSMVEGYTNDVFILDTKEWVWSKCHVSGLSPSPRDKHTACLLENKMYVFGGFGPLIVSANGDDNGSEEDGQDGSDRSDNQAMSESDDEESEEEDDDAAMSFTWFDDLYVLDVVSNIWQKVETTGLKPSPRAAHAAFITKAPGDSKIGRLVVFGGRDPVGRQNDMYSLDLQAMQWKKETSICPPARSFHSLVQLGDSLFAVCYGGVGATGEMFPGLEVLNVETMEWTSLKSSSGTWPSLRGASALVWNLDKEACQVIMFGGSCSIEDRDPLYFNDCYIFDMSSLLKGV